MPLKGGGGIRWDRGKASHLKEREIINWLQLFPVIALKSWLLQISPHYTYKDDISFTLLGFLCVHTPKQLLKCTSASSSFSSLVYVLTCICPE